MTEESLSEKCTAVVVNYQTPDLLAPAVRSFAGFYPGLHILVVDNGSRDESPTVITGLQNEIGPSLEPLFLDRNVYHGPALHLALEHVETPYAYIFDSDTVTLKGGFLEEQLSLLEANPNAYGTGKITHANRRGFADPKGVPVLVSAHMVIRVPMYHSLPPFVHHGLPALFNFSAAHEQHYALIDYPIAEYVSHLGRGTVKRFGYGLGWKSRLDFLLNRIGR